MLNYKILIGIPAYNEKETIERIVTEAKEFGDVLVVDDGSNDDTGRLALSVGAKVIKFYKNLGYGSALIELLKQAKKRGVDILVVLDGDGQHNPLEIPHFVEAIRKGADVVVGNRFLEKTDIPSYRKIGVKVFSSFVDVGDSQCGFRAYNKKAIDSIRLKEKGMGVSLEVLQRAKELKLRIVEVPCSISYGNTSHSQHPLRHGFSLVGSLFWETVWKKPMLLLGLPALISLVFGGIFAFLVIDSYVKLDQFRFGLAILALGGLLVGVMLGVAALFVLFGKKLLEELKWVRD